LKEIFNLNKKAMYYENKLKHNQKVGEYGEMLAKNYLIKQGYTIIDQNIQVGRQEIDILAKIKDIFVFIEVKTRASDTHGTAEDAMNRKKTANLKKGVKNYIDRKKIDANFIRVDFIAIDIDKLSKKANIKHYEDII
jgi:putative endonuclease